MYRTAALAAWLSGVLLVTGCALTEPSDQADPSEDASPSGEASSTVEKVEEPEQLPDWFVADQETVLAENQVYDAALQGNVMLTMTLSEVVARSLPDLKAAYAVRPPSGGHFVDIETVGESVYALEVFDTEDVGTRVGDQKLAVRRFSVDAGTIDAETEVKLRKKTDDAGKAVLKIASVVGNSVVVQLTVPDTFFPPSVHVVDLGEETVAWKSDKSRFVAATEDQVIVHQSGRSGGELIARDARTGDEMWRALPGSTGVRTVGMDGELLTVVAQSAAGNSVVALNTANGRALGKAQPTTRDPDWNCRPAEPPVAVCSLPEKNALAFDLESGKELWRLPTRNRYGIWVSAVAGDRVYGFTEGGRSVVLDAATGRDVTPKAGASPSVVNGFGGIVFYGGKAVFYPAGEGDPPTE